MNLESTLATIGQYIPEELDKVIDHAASYIPEDVSSVIKHASAYFPTEIDITSAAEFMLYFSASSLILGVLSRVVLGKRSSLNHSLSSVMAILFVYAMTVVVYTFQPWNLAQLLSPLPFVTFAQEYLIVLPVTDAAFPALCEEILSLVILAFLVNLLDTLIPRGEGILSWFILRFLAVALSLVLHVLVSWAFHTFLPNVLVTYAPMILLLLLVFMLLSGIINLIFSLLIIMTNPFMGAMYTFFFSNIIGKQLTKAFFTGAIIGTVVYLLEFFGYTVICITSAALMTYIPLALVFLLLWYLIGRAL